MEVDEKPKEDYTDIGGLDKQIKELVEAVVLPITHKDLFKKIGIKPPKGKFCYEIKEYYFMAHLELEKHY
jgi:26S proteasome regulatory subunit T5